MKQHILRKDKMTTQQRFNKKTFMTEKEFDKVVKKAEEGCPEYLYKLGRCYEYGIFVEKDNLKAFDKYHSSYIQGHKEAQDKLDRNNNFLNAVLFDVLEISIDKLSVLSSLRSIGHSNTINFLEEIFNEDSK